MQTTFHNHLFIVSCMNEILLETPFHLSVHPSTTSKAQTRRTDKSPGPGCSKLTTLLVNVSLTFQMLISEIRHYFLLKKYEKLLQKLLSFF